MASNGRDEEGPRELEIFSDEQVEEVMESLEYFKGKIEHLQLYCEQVNKSRLKTEEALVEQKRIHNQELAKYDEEMNCLRNANIQLMSNNVATPEKRGNFSAAVLSCAIDAKNTEARIKDLSSKVRSLELTMAEKDKHISLMEWQIVDLEATISTLQAERDQLVLELDLRHPNNDQNDDTLRDDDFQEDLIPEEKPVDASYSDGLPWGIGTESLSLRQMLSMSAEWTVNKTCVANVSRFPQRTFSDHMKRETRENSFKHPNATHSLEDFEDYSEADSGLGLGKLTRTTNFYDILDADEYSNIHVVDNRLSIADSVLEVHGEETGSALQPLSKKWATFESGLANSLEEDAFGKGNTSEISLTSHDGVDKVPQLTSREPDSLGSSTSDFGSACHSSQDILISSTEEAWEAVKVCAPSQEEVQCLSKTEISKSDSCILKTRAKSPEEESMWNFTPDSVVNVSTGEMLIPSVVKTPPSPSLETSCSFTTSIEIVVNNPQAPVEATQETAGGVDVDNCEQIVDTIDKDVEHVEGSKEHIECDGKIVDNVVLRHKAKDGITPRNKHREKSKSAIGYKSPSEEEDTKGLESRHKKSLSDPIKKTDEKRGLRKLKEYQKWQKYGRRGKPPADLKISDC